MGALKHTAGYPNMWGIQTYGGVQIYGASKDTGGIHTYGGIETYRGPSKHTVDVVEAWYSLEQYIGL